MEAALLQYIGTVGLGLVGVGIVAAFVVIVLGTLALYSQYHG